MILRKFPEVDSNSQRLYYVDVENNGADSGVVFAIRNSRGEIVDYFGELGEDGLVIYNGLTSETGISTDGAGHVKVRMQ